MDDCEHIQPENLPAGRTPEMEIDGDDQNGKYPFEERVWKSAFHSCARTCCFKNAPSSSPLPPSFPRFLAFLVGDGSTPGFSPKALPSRSRLGPDPLKDPKKGTP